MTSLGLAALLLFGAADAGALRPQDLATRLDPEKVHLGEPFVYELRLTHGKDDRYELRSPKELGPFEVVSQERAREDVAGGAQGVTVFRLRMAAFELGSHPLPALVFDVVSPSATGTFEAPGAEVTVEGTLSDEAVEKGEALYDIEPPAEVAVRTYRLLWIALGVAAAAALGYLIYRRWRRPKVAPVVPARAPDPLDVRTLTALDNLRIEDLHGQGRFREFHFRLSEIIRGYLGERFGFDAMESTSGELLAALKQRGAAGVQLDAFERHLLDADLVKFARAATNPDSCRRELGFARQLVLTTTAAAAAPPAAEASVKDAARPLS